MKFAQYITPFFSAVSVLILIQCQTNIEVFDPLAYFELWLLITFPQNYMSFYLHPMNR